VASIVVVGFCGTVETYLLLVRPKLATMEWTRLKSDLWPCTGHSFVSAPMKGQDGELTVATLGGLLNEENHEPGVGRNNSYLNIFNVI